MKFVSSLAALALVVSGQAQKVITVRNQHSKVLINTLDKDEFIVRGETRIMLKTDGESYEYLTQKEGKYRHYENSRILQILPFARFDRPVFYTYNEKENGEWVVYGKIGQKTIGPYKRLQFYYSDDKRTEDLHGYMYETAEGQFVVDRVANKTYGPFEDARWNHIDRKYLFILAKNGGKVTVIDRSKSYGPYEDAQFLYTGETFKGTTFIYQDKGVWRIQAPVSIDMSFTQKPDLRYAPDGSWQVCGIPVGSDGKQRIFLQNGTSYLHTAESQTLLYPGMPVLTIERSAGGIQPGFTGRFDSNQSYTVKRGDEVLGEFYLDALYGQKIKNPDKIYPIAFYRKVPEGISESKKEFCLLRVDKGFTNPIPIKYRYTISWGGDGYAYVDVKEGTLYLNGEKQAYNNVELVDMSDYPENWLMAAKEGYYTTFYKNGKPDPAATLEKKSAYPRFASRNRPYIFVTENDKSYAKAPQSAKLFGPVNPRSVITFSKNNAHYAEGDERNAQVLIDGKVIGSGYGLVYNANKNAFHWVEQQGQKLYLHTYELD